MAINLMHKEQSTFENSINNVISAYSKADEEELSRELLEVLRSSHLMDILDANRPQGGGNLRDILYICQALGKIDASLAWIAGVSNSAWVMRNHFRSLDFSNQAIRSNNILSMVLGRPGLLKKSNTFSSYLLNGEWRYASGWKYSSYFFCLASIEDSNGQDIRAVAVPAEKLKIIEEWKATGLRATQSVTIRADNIEVPECDMEDYSHILSGKNAMRSNLSTSKNITPYTGQFTGVLMNCLLGAILGATEAALLYVADIAEKGPIAGSTYLLMSDSGAIRSEIGRLHCTLDLYKRAAEYNADIIDNVACNPNNPLSTQQRVENRGRATLIMRGCVDIMQDLLWIYGSSGLNKGSFLEKIWRDINVGARHGGFSKFVPEEAVGLAIIGRDPKNLTKMF